MALHAHGEGLGAAEGEEAVERPGHGADRVLKEAQAPGEAVVASFKATQVRLLGSG